ncbi:MAG TPA: hypothetical protein VGR89_01155, partial [Puia sp.]|nr:hypothetical protein [Puia sp.]
CRSSFSLSKYKMPFSALINRYYGIDVAFNERDISRQVRPGNWDIRALSAGKTTYIDTCHNFYPYHYRFSWVNPVPAIADRIGNFDEKIKQRKCIGLHIRRTDNRDSVENSPDFLFENAIRDEIRRDPSAVFFLATDDYTTQSHFTALFGPERILAHPKKFGRDSVEAIRDAVVDWMLLTKCSKLYCSYYSSFSETVIDVSKAPAITLKIQPGNDKKIDQGVPR